MSGIVQKVEETIHKVTHPKDKQHGTTTTTGTAVPASTAGPHGSHVTNAADPRLDSNLDSRAHHGTSAGIGGTSTTAHHGTSTTGVGSTTSGSTTAGPHKSDLLNKLDPRVDSDLDGSSNAGMNKTTGNTGRVTTSGHAGHAGTSNIHSGTHTTTTGIGGTTGSTNAGPHNSNALNYADPRVDSDLDGSRNAGLNQTTNTHGHTGVTGTTGTGIGNTTGSTNAGPHNSNLLNKMDPRVDSNLDGSRNAGLNQTTGRTGHTTTGHTGHTTAHTTTTGIGGTAGSTNAGPHNSNALNYADPRVDSDLDGSRNAGLNQTTNTHGHTGVTGTTGTTGTGIGNTTGSTNAGPHNSNLLNKMDPRVDSNLDGSRNAGLNQTTRPGY